MTASILDQSPPDEEDFIACWMTPVVPTAVERKQDDPFPFCVAARVSGPDDPNSGTDDPVVQLDFYGRGVVEAKSSASQGHQRMLYLFRYHPTVTMSDGSLADIDFGETLIKPCRMPFAHDTVVRYTARYKLGLSYVTVT